MKTVSEIILNEFSKAGLDPQENFRKIIQFVKDGKAFFMRKADTVLLVKMIDTNVGELHIFTQDSPIMIARAVKQFWQDLVKLGIHTVYGKAENEQIVKLMKIVRAPIIDSDKEQYTWRAEIC